MTDIPFEYLFAPLETQDGWFMLLGRDLADPAKFQGFDENTGSLKYDGCRCDDFHGPFKSLEELYKFAVNDLVDLIRECHKEAEDNQTDIRNFGDEMNRQDQQIVTQGAEIERYKQWVDDLQSGMYVNCVYCGHRYGPKEDTPATMADVLKEHIEQCPKHPMSALKAENTILQNQVTEQAKNIISLQDAANDLIDALAIPAGRDLERAWNKALTIFSRYCEPYLGMWVKPFVLNTTPEMCVRDEDDCKACKDELGCKLSLLKEDEH